MHKPLSSPQTILVTGANQGIGRELALQLASQGHTVIAWARNAERLASLQRQAPSIHTLSIDLANTSLLPGAVADLLVQHPCLSGVIHNAAIQQEVFLDHPKYTAQAIAEEIAINLTAPLVLTHALLPQLRKQSGAFVCNISSALALAAKRNSAVYCATKAGLHLFSDSLRAQWAQAGVAVQLTEIMPPTVATQMTAHRSVPKMPPAQVATQTLDAIRAGKRSVLLGKGKLLGMLLYLVPPLAKKSCFAFNLQKTRLFWNRNYENNTLYFKYFGRLCLSRGRTRPTSQCNLRHQRALVRCCR